MTESESIIAQGRGQSRWTLSRFRQDGFTLFIYHVFRWILGSIFIYASYDKILHPSDFAAAVYNYQILPDTLINLTALVMPWLELFLGILLILGVWMPGAILLANFLLMVFTGTLVFNLYRGLNINCGCFSTSLEQKTADIWTVARDASFMLLSLYLLLYYYFFSSRKPVKKIPGSTSIYGVE